MAGRLALVIELLTWASTGGPQPTAIALRSIEAAIKLIDDYFVPMAERVYGDAARLPEERDAVALLRAIQTRGARTLNQRDVYKNWRVSGLNKALGWSAGSHEMGSASFVAQMPTSKDGGFLRLAYTIEGVSYSQRIAIVALACRYGGSRYYFVCLLSGRRCEVLARVNGLWASLKVQRLAYRSQSEDQRGRLGRAARKARARAWGLNQHPKPRGENAKTAAAPVV